MLSTRVARLPATLDFREGILSCFLSSHKSWFSAESQPPQRDSMMCLAQEEVPSSSQNSSHTTHQTGNAQSASSRSMSRSIIPHSCVYVLPPLRSAGPPTPTPAAGTCVMIRRCSGGGCCCASGVGAGSGGKGGAGVAPTPPPELFAPAVHSHLHGRGRDLWSTATRRRSRV